MAQGEPSITRVPSALIEILLLGEAFPPKRPAPMVDLSATWATARSRWQMEDREGDVHTEEDRA